MVIVADRKELLRHYKESHRPAGVFRILNVGENRSFVGSSTNVPGLLNRHRFELEMGSHRNKPLQADWNRLGESGFSFETLDLLDPPADDPSWNPAEEVAELETMWRERILAEGGELY